MDKLFLLVADSSTSPKTKPSSAFFAWSCLPINFARERDARTEQDERPVHRQQDQPDLKERDQVRGRAVHHRHQGLLPGAAEWCARNNAVIAPFTLSLQSRWHGDQGRVCFCFPSLAWLGDRPSMHPFTAELTSSFLPFSRSEIVRHGGAQEERAADPAQRGDLRLHHLPWH
jgi:hypothetical protein